MEAAPCRPRLLHQRFTSHQRPLCRGRPLGMRDNVEVRVTSVGLSAVCG